MEPVRSIVAALAPGRLLKVIVLGNLVTSFCQPHTRFTYHRTWETGLEVAAEPPLLTPNFFAPKTLATDLHGSAQIRHPLLNKGSNPRSAIAVYVLASVAVKLFR